MNNLQIKKQNKRSVESLIEDSAIDNVDTFNFEIYQMKKAYHQTNKSMNLKISQQAKQIDRLLIKNREIIQQIKDLEMKNVQLEKLSNQQIQKSKDLQILNEKLKKRLKFVQNKLQTIQDNRNLAKGNSGQKDSFDLELPHSTSKSKQNAIRTQIYKEITDIMNIKVRQFTAQLKQHLMSQEVETSIEVFLEQLIYLNPHSTQTGFKFRSHKERDIGKISRRISQNISDQQQWKNMQKSIEKLKTSQSKRNVFNNIATNATARKQNTFNRAVTPKRQRKTSPFNYSYQPLQSGDNRPLEQSNVNRSRSKKKIFQN